MPVLAALPIGYGQPNGWSVALGDIIVVGGEIEALGTDEGPGHCDIPTVTGCLTLPPDGLGIPALRTQDTSYLGRDGVRHHEDWYEPRIVTLQVSIGKASTCGCDPSASVRGLVQQLTAEWGRVCGTERELVLYPPNCSCDDLNTGTQDLDRPLAVVGRPRQASVVYTRSGTADVTLRFDATDHLMYLLDCCGTPGSNVKCAVMTPTIDTRCRQYDRCYTACSPGVSGWSYDVAGGTVGGPATFTGGGSQCVAGTLTLYGPLTNPAIESETADERLVYTGAIPAGGSVVINTGLGTATEDGVDRTGRLSGDLVMLVQPNANTWRLQAYSGTDDGYAELCWRPAVVAA